VYSSKSSWNPSSYVLETDWPQPDRLTARVTAHPYSSAIVSLSFHSSRGGGRGGINAPQERNFLRFLLIFFFLISLLWNLVFQCLRPPLHAVGTVPAALLCGRSNQTAWCLLLAEADCDADSTRITRGHSLYAYVTQKSNKKNYKTHCQN